MASDHLPVVADYTLAIGDLDVASNEINSKVELYPNPATDLVKIVLGPEVGGRVSIQIIDLQGKIVEEKSLNPVRELNIDVSALSTGNYAVKVVTGHQLFVGRLVVVRE